MSNTSLSSIDLEWTINPDHATILGQHWTLNSKLTLLIMSHEYMHIQQNVNLYSQLEIFRTKYPEIPIFVEELHGLRKSEKSAYFPNPAMRFEAATLALANPRATIGEALAEFWPTDNLLVGVDDAVLLTAQQSSYRDICGRIAASSRNVTDNHYYLDKFDQLLTRSLRIIGERISNLPLDIIVGLEQDRFRQTYTQRMEFLYKLAMSAGVVLQKYRSFAALQKAMELQKHTNFQKAEAERKDLVTRLLQPIEHELDHNQWQALHLWFKDTQNASIIATRKLSSLAPEYDLGSGDPSEYELNAENLTRMVGMRVIALTAASLFNYITNSFFHAMLGRLIECLGWSFDGMREMKKYIESSELLNQVDQLQLIQFEEPALLQELSENFAESSVQLDLLRLYRDLDDIRNLTQLTLPAHRAKKILNNRLSLSRWADDMFMFADHVLNDTNSPIQNSAFQSEVRKFAHVIDECLPYALDYYRASFTRSQTLIQKTIEQAVDQHPTAILVCARYHLYEIQNLLRNEENISWVLITPKIEETDSSNKSSGQSIQAWYKPRKEISLIPSSEHENCLRQWPILVDWLDERRFPTFQWIDYLPPLLQRFRSSSQHTTLNYLPGMPKLTFVLTYRLYKYPDLCLRLVPTPSDKLRSTDTGAYQVYLGNYDIGRFTIRSTSSFIERNFLCVLSSNQAILSKLGILEARISSGVGGTFWRDWWRIAEEYIWVLRMILPQLE